MCRQVKAECRCRSSLAPGVYVSYRCAENDPDGCALSGHAQRPKHIISIVFCVLTCAWPLSFLPQPIPKASHHSSTGALCSIKLNKIRVNVDYDLVLSNVMH